MTRAWCEVRGVELIVGILRDGRSFASREFCAGSVPFPSPSSEKHNDVLVLRFQANCGGLPVALLSGPVDGFAVSMDSDAK